MRTEPEQTALFAFITPGLNIPVNIPVAVRTGSDYGLRFTVSEITQATPLAGADLTFWGFPAEEAHDKERFAKGSAGEPAGCVGLAGTGCIKAPSESTLPEAPLTDNPTICTGQPLATSLEVQTYQDPTHPTREDGHLPGHDRLRARGLQASPLRRLDHRADRFRHLVSTSSCNAPQFLTRAAAPSQIRTAIVTLPEGFTINPDAADGQGACTDAQANFHTESAPNCPDSSKIGTFALHTVALDGPLQGAVYIGQPKPGATYRLFMAADGFGIHAKLEGQVIPDPTTGHLTVRFTDLPQVPFDDLAAAPLRIRQRPDGDPDQLRPASRDAPSSSPGTRSWPIRPRSSSSASPQAPGGPVPRAGAPLPPDA